MPLTPSIMRVTEAEKASEASMLAGALSTYLFHDISTVEAARKRRKRVVAKLFENTARL